VNLIAADLVEVAPAYDTNAEHTTMAAADVLYEVMTLMVSFSICVSQNLVQKSLC
jgi:agmatinase